MDKYQNGNYAFVVLEEARMADPWNTQNILPKSENAKPVPIKPRSDCRKRIVVIVLVAILIWIGSEIKENPEGTIPKRPIPIFQIDEICRDLCFDHGDVDGWRYREKRVTECICEDGTKFKPMSRIVHEVYKILNGSIPAR